MFGNKDCIAVLNFLATKIEFLIARKIVNDNIKIIANSICDYAGYIDGEFLELDNLYEAIEVVMNGVSDNLLKKIDSIYIGVPAEFCNYALKNLKANYNNKVVIKKSHIDDLFAEIADNSIDEDYTVISKSPIYYVLDDGVQTINPEGCYSKNLGAKASFILAKNAFIDEISDIMHSFKFKDVCFVPEILAIDSSMLDESVRQNGAIVINFDYVSTSVTSIVGEGIIDLKTFALGEGHILADMAEVLKLGYYSSEELKKQLILTLEPNPMDNYEIIDESGRSIKVSANLANEVVKARLDNMIEVINKIIFNFQYKQDRSLPIYITGSGVASINGARNYLTKKLGRKCEILIPKQVEYSEAKYVTKIGLIHFIYDCMV